MKNFFTVLSLSFFFFLFVFSVAKAADPLNAYLFYGDGCPHCEKEIAFLKTIESKYPDLKIKSFEIYHNQENLALLQKVAKSLGASSGGIPFLIIGDKYFIGFSESLTPIEIENRINECLTSAYSDSVAKILEDSGIEGQNNLPEKNKVEEKGTETEKEKIIHFPLFGDVNIYKMSLPVLTVAIGILDGFNPCAMWALIFLISLLIGMEDRKKMWILGSTFIIVSALVYFIFMSAWLNLILFLGFVAWIRILIGLVALAAGGYNLKDFLQNDNTCKVSGNEKSQKIFEKLKLAISQKSFYFAFGGIIVLAFMVNLVELICSAGFPAIYTQILAMNNLSTLGYYSYILLYIFFFMLDDLIVFFIAMITLRMTGVTTKYSKYSKLIGGLIMLIVGVLLILKPEILMFG